MSIEIVHGIAGQFGNHTGPIRKTWRDVSPVLLLDVGIVILLVRSTPCELDLGARVHAETQQMVVDELIAIIGIDPL